MRILLIDDSSFVRLVGRRSLEKAGYTVLIDAHDGADGLRKAKELKPDLVVVDIALPKVNGFEVASRILEAQPYTLVLAISAIDEDWVREKSIEAGCFDFLAKPFEPEQLLERVAHAVSLKESLKYG